MVSSNDVFTSYGASLRKIRLLEKINNNLINNCAGRAMCESRAMAKTVYYTYQKIMYDVLAAPSAFGCPVACTQATFDVNLQYFHETAFMKVEDEVFFNLINWEW